MAFGAGHPYLRTRVSLRALHLLPPGALREVIDKPLDDLRPLFSRAGAGALLTEDIAHPRFPLRQRQQRLAIVLNDVRIFLRSLSGHSREFLLYWVHILELLNLKTILRGRMFSQDPAVVREQLLDMGPFTTLPTEALLRAENELEVLRQLERTPFAELARQARHVMEEHRDLFYLDTAFDRRFYYGLVRRAEMLRPSDPRGFRSMMQALIDGTNLLWLLRYRFVYGIPPAETYYLLIPARFRLNADQLKTLTGLGSVQAVLAGLPKSVADWVGEARTIEEVSISADRYLRATAEYLLRYSQSAITRTFAYLLLRERDLNLLRGLVKGAQLGVNPAIRREALGDSAGDAEPGLHV